MSQTSSLAADSPSNWQGVFAVLGAMSLYAGNFVASRYSIQAGLTAYDLTALRFGTAGLLLLPFLIRYDITSLAGIGWARGIILAVLAGAPYMMLIFGGLHFSPAAHGAVLNPGFVPVVAAAGMWLAAGIRVSLFKGVALVIIITGLMLVTSFSLLTNPATLFGDLLLLLSGLSWGVFTVLLRHWQLNPWRVAVVVSVLSMIYLPFYLLLGEQHITLAPLNHVIAQMIFQGLALSIFALFMFSYAVKALGPHHASIYAPLVPVLSTLFSIPLLHEIPSLQQWVGISLVVAGMYLAARFSR